MTEATQAFDFDVSAAFVNDLNILCRLHDREPDAALIGALQARPVSQWFAMKLQGAAFDEGARLMQIALEELPQKLERNALDKLSAEYAAIYLTHAYRASPYESVWIDEDHLERQGPMFAVQAWYQKHGLKSPDWKSRPEDHLAYELSFLSLLIEKAGHGGSVQEAGDFLRKHLLVWTPDFSARVVARCREAFYAGAAILTVTYLEALKKMFEDVFALDMTVIRPENLSGKSDGPRRPTSGNSLPPPSFIPGSAPTW